MAKNNGAEKVKLLQNPTIRAEPVGKPYNSRQIFKNIEDMLGFTAEINLEGIESLERTPLLAPDDLYKALKA